MEQSTKGIRARTVILSGLLVLSMASNIYLVYSGYSNKKLTQKYEDTAYARLELENEFASTTTELGKFKGLSQKLDSLLWDANRTIGLQKSRINSLAKGSTDSKLLRGELKRLRQLRESYINKIDELISENKQLKNHNAQLMYTVSTSSIKEGPLEEKVNTTSPIRAEHVEINAFKRRFSGKYVSTSIARKTNKISICFEVPENESVKSGEKKAYVRILAPNGLPLGNYSEGTKIFINKETREEMLYSLAQSFSYNKEQQNLCMDYEEKERNLASGTYMIEIYFDGVLSCTSFYTLR